MSKIQLVCACFGLSALVACLGEKEDETDTAAAVGGRADTSLDTSLDTASSSLVAAVPRIYCADGSEDCSVLEFDGTESGETSDGSIVSYGWEINGETLDDSVTVQYDFSELFVPDTLFEGTLTVTDEFGETDTAGMLMYAISKTDDCEETAGMVWNKLIRPGFSIGGQCVMQSGLVGGCFNPDQTYAFSWTDSSGTESTLTPIVDTDNSVIRVTELIDPGTGTLKITKSICDEGVWVDEDYCFEVTCDPTADFTITYSQVSCDL